MKTTVFILFAFIVLTTTQAFGQNLLNDANFESSIPNGTWPSSGVWDKSWYPFKAGAVTTSTAALKGKCGLWIYTSYGNSFSKPSQEVKCKPNQKYKATAWLQSPWNQNWTEGTKAYIRLTFLDTYRRKIISATSDMLQAENSGWKQYEIVLAAPQNTKWARYEIVLESLQGQSICTADNCFLTEL